VRWNSGLVLLSCVPTVDLADCEMDEFMDDGGKDFFQMSQQKRRGKAGTPVPVLVYIIVGADDSVVL
jgi:hypothetical protein